MPLYPISFAIPKSKITDIIPSKQKLMSHLTPGKISGNLSTYIYNTETDYYNEYKSSIFAITTKRAGWDCMRHYEILACGTIPYFPDIDKCPSNTMTHLPKDLIKQGNALYESCINKSILELNTSEALTLSQKLLDYTKNNLSTVKMAQYILNKSNNSSASKILFLSGSIEPDYLRCLILEGFKELLGKQCHDFPKIPHIYQSNHLEYSKLYGKGITYTNLINEELHDYNLDSTVEQDIIEHKYDIIIYGSYHRGMPFYDKVISAYKPSEIILLCGEDLHHCDYSTYVYKGYHVFVREL
jgi:hypothetical protein